MKRTRRTPRGQATVEATLGILVFVTVLMFGIHFSEIVFTEMKVTEAAAAPMWDSTAGPMHVIPFQYNLVDQSVAMANMDAWIRYADFDGRMSKFAGATPSQVFTTANGMQVGCAVGAGIGFRGDPFVWPVYRDNRGMWCSSQAAIGTQRIPSGFLDQGGDGLFQAQHQDSNAFTNGIPVCGVGRPQGGACNPGRRFSMMIDDWGLANLQREAAQCVMLPLNVPCLTNFNYWSAVNTIFQLNGGGQGSAHRTLVRTVVGYEPMFLGSATSFYMSYVGEEMMFAQPIIPLDFGFPLWNTTPFLFPPTYAISYAMRKGCYLGKECNTSSLSSP